MKSEYISRSMAKKLGCPEAILDGLRCVVRTNPIIRGGPLMRLYKLTDILAAIDEVMQAAGQDGREINDLVARANSKKASGAVDYGHAHSKMVLPTRHKV